MNDAYIRLSTERRKLREKQKCISITFDAIEQEDLTADPIFLAMSLRSEEPNEIFNLLIALIEANFICCSEIFDQGYDFCFCSPQARKILNLLINAAKEKDRYGLIIARSELALYITEKILDLEQENDLEQMIYFYRFFSLFITFLQLNVWHAYIIEYLSKKVKESDIGILSREFVL